MEKKNAQEIKKYLESIKEVDVDGLFREFVKDNVFVAPAAIKAYWAGFAIQPEKIDTEYEQLWLGHKCVIFDGDDVITSKHNAWLAEFEKALKEFDAENPYVPEAKEKEPKKTEKISCHLDKKSGKVTVDLPTGKKEFKDMNSFNLWKDGIMTSREVIVTHKDNAASFHGGNPSKMSVMHLMFDETRKNKDNGAAGASNVPKSKKVNGKEMDELDKLFVKMLTPERIERICKRTGMDELKDMVDSDGNCDIPNLEKTAEKAAKNLGLTAENFEEKFEDFAVEIIKLSSPKKVDNGEKAMSVINLNLIYKYISKESLDLVLAGFTTEQSAEIYKAIEHEIKSRAQFHKDKFQHTLDLSPNTKNHKMLLFGYGDVRWAIVINNKKKSFSRFFGKDVTEDDVLKYYKSMQNK